MTDTLLLLRIPGYEGQDALLIFFLLLVTQMSDVLQYVFGKLFGRHKIAPRISPGKTVEGFVGGIAGAAQGSDLAALNDKRIAVTPLRLDMTDEPFMTKLADMFE